MSSNIFQNIGSQFQQLGSNPASTLLNATAGRGGRFWYSLALAFLIIFALILAGLAIAQLVKWGQGENPSATDAISVSAYVFLVLTALATVVFLAARANKNKIERRISKVEDLENAETEEERAAAGQALWRDTAGDVRDIARYGLGVNLPPTQFG
jgi:hypothetical protein